MARLSWTWFLPLYHIMHIEPTCIEICISYIMTWVCWYVNVLKLKKRIHSLPVWLSTNIFVDDYYKITSRYFLFFFAAISLSGVSCMNQFCIIWLSPYPMVFMQNLAHQCSMLVVSFTWKWCFAWVTM